ncbi:MAG: hypothetical protein EXS22_10790 [Pedosphaera sp.]|nr:hypothetical protein [Pedosphaera sp.]MSU44498.1 hypothetical protein [Pedosphaera sp.]
MSSPYPKLPNQIHVRVTDRELRDGMAGKVIAATDTTLDLVMLNYLQRMGFGSAYLGGIIVHLLSNGKVRVDFAARSERVELVNTNDLLTQPQAMALFDDYLNSQKTGEDKKAKSATMRIEVQKPRQ